MAQQDDLKRLARATLFINTKDGGNKTLVFNRAQEYIHERLEQQLREKGLIRAIILKGRQQGCSTYVGARFFFNSIVREKRTVFVLAHQASSTAALFDMVHNYKANLLFHLETARASQRELVFQETKSAYKVGTAGSDDVGRGTTIHYFHGSEVAFWPNAQKIATGVLQAVSTAPGTEIILESTANGVGGFFYEQWHKAIRGESPYIAIFVPWYWQPEYRTLPPDDFVLTAEEREIKGQYTLDDEQIKWMRDKRAELGEVGFKQEYPFNAAEAFQTTGENTFITPQIIVNARRCEPVNDKEAPLIVGCDPARYGDDKTAIAYRQGRNAPEITVHEKLDNMQVAGMLANLIDRAKPKKVFIDLGGGAGIYDRLKELGYKDVVVGVNFGGSPDDGKRYANKRVEMWANMKKWLEDQPAKIPDDDALHADLIAPTYTFDSSGRLKLESKEDMRKRGVKSPDRADALALTFAQPVASDAVSGSVQGKKAIHDSIFG